MVEGAVAARLEEIERRLNDAESRIDALIVRTANQFVIPSNSAAFDVPGAGRTAVGGPG